MNTQRKEAHRLERVLDELQSLNNELADDTQIDQYYHALRVLNKRYRALTGRYYHGNKTEQPEPDRT